MPSAKYKTLSALVVTLLGLLGMAAVAPPPAAGATNTIVSLTFDDGHATHYAAAMSMMRPRGLVGTFYINSAMVGSSGYYMTWPQIHDIAAAGNEIGGHTLHHTNLNNASAATARTEVCDDRTALIAQGFSPVSSFAYPEAAVNPTAEQIVQECGYTTGRGVGDLYSDGPYAETIPPQDPYKLRTTEGATTSTTLADLQASVTDAETHGGGWVPLVFHGICDNRCTNENTVTTATFTAFLDWLAPRSANGTVVRTVDQAMSGSSNPPPPPPPTTPTTSIACNGSTCSTGWYDAPVEITLSPSGASGAATRYTTDGSDPATSGIAYTGPFSVSSTSTVKYQSSADDWANAEPVKSTLVRIDAAPPTVSLTSPKDGASVKAGSQVQLNASAVDSGTSPGTASGVASVSYYLDGGTKIGTATASPYRVTWKVPRNMSGTHTLTGMATDAAGNRTTSSGVRVTVTRCTLLCLG